MNTHNTIILVNTDILNSLFKNCAEKESGTFFLVTDDNKSFHITIDQGKLKEYSLGGENGFSALANFNSINFVKFSFSKDLVLATNQNATIENSDEALESLGYKEYLNAQLLAKNKENEITEPRIERRKTDRRVRMYRGQPIDETEAKKNKDHPPSAERRKEERRITGMYRGQPIYEKN